MYLRDIPSGMKVTVQVHDRVDIVERVLTVKYYDKSTKQMLFEPVYEEGTLLSFELRRKDTECEIFYSDGSVTYIFKRVKMFNMLDGEEWCHACLGNIRSDVLNQRDAIRHVVRLKCEYTRGPHRGSTDGIIRDVSLSGFACLIKGHVAVGDEPTVFVQFPPGYIVGGKVKVVGTVVRIVSNGDEDDLKLVGCTVNTETREYRNWLMALDRERARNLRGKCNG